MVDGAQRGENALKRLSTQARRTESDFDRLHGAWNTFTGILQAAAVFEIARGLAALSDQVTNAMNGLRLVTRTAEETNAVYEALMRQSNSLGVEFSKNAELFKRLSISTRDMNLSYRELLDLTLRLNQAMIISGGSTSEGAAALRQLGQALGKQSLNGDELVSILENAPRVAQIIADSMGVPVGALKTLGAQGKLTATEIVEAFRNAGPELDAEMAKVAPTIERSLNVVKNKLFDFMKGLNDNGFGKAVAGAIMFIADNFDVLAGAIIGVSVALIGSLIPSLVAASAAFLATPLGWFVVGLAAIGAGLVIFGNQSYEMAGKTATGWEWIRAAMETVGERISPLIDAFMDMWVNMTNGLNEWLASWGITWESIGKVLKDYINFQFAAWKSAGMILGEIWSNFPGVWNVVWTGILNLGASALEALINSWQAGLRSIVTMVRPFNEELADSMSGALDSVTLRIPRAQLSASGQEAAGVMRDAMAGVFNPDDVVGDFIADTAANVRPPQTTNDSALDNIFGGSGNAMPGKDDDGSAARKAETRAEMMERFNRQTQNAIDLAQRYYTVARAQGDLDQMNEELKRRRFAEMSGPEKAAMLDQLQRMHDEQDLQQTRDGILRAAIEPQREYNRGVRAISQLLADHALTAEQAARAQRDLDIAFLQTKRDMESGIQLARLQIADDIENDAARIASAMKSLETEANGPVRELAAQVQALNALFETGAVSAEFYARKMQELGVAQLNLKISMGDGTMEDAILAGMAKILDGYTGVVAGLRDIWGDFFTSLADGFADVISRAIVYGEDLEEGFKKLAQTILSQMIGALIKLGIQWVIQKLMGDALMAGTVATNAAAGTAVAAAWAPAAAMVSLATMGANAGPAMAGIAMTTGLAQILSIAGGAGFREGGFTGHGGLDDVAGVVHGREFVVNAEATRRHRGLLEAINRGQPLPTSMPMGRDSTIASGMKIEVMNFSTADIKVEQLGEGRARIIAREEAVRAVREEAPRVIAGQIGDPNSGVSKQLSRSTRTERRR